MEKEIDWFEALDADWWKSAVRPKQHTDFGSRIKSLKKQLARVMVQERARTSSADALLCLRDSGIPLEPCLKLAKIMGDKLTAQKELEHASWLAEVINTSEKKEGFIG